MYKFEFHRLRPLPFGLSFKKARFLGVSKMITFETSDLKEAVAKLAEFLGNDHEVHVRIVMQLGSDGTVLADTTFQQLYNKESLAKALAEHDEDLNFASYRANNLMIKIAEAARYKMAELKALEEAQELVALYNLAQALEIRELTRKLQEIFS